MTNSTALTGSTGSTESIVSTGSKYMFVKRLSNNACLCRDSTNELFVAKYGSKKSTDLLKEIAITTLLSRGSCVMNNNFISINTINENDSECDRECNRGLCDCCGVYSCMFSCMFSCMTRCLTKCSCCSYKNTRKHNVTMSVHADGDIIYTITDKNHDTSSFSSVVSIDRSHNRHYMILKHAGTDLYEWIVSQKSVPETTCKMIFRHLVRAVKSIHTLGIAHCDISLENICSTSLSTCGKVKLIDFGMSLIHPLSPYHGIIKNFTYGRACIVNNLDDITVMMIKMKPSRNMILYGKKQYMSPERYDAHQNEHNFYCAYADDVYSLGVVLFCMLLGRMPYDIPNESDDMFQEVISGKWISKVKKYYSRDVIVLLDMILKREESRITLDQIIQHRWLTCA